MSYSRTKILYIFRGLPGSGKSTAAKKIGCIVVEPQDQWATRNGTYYWIKEEAEIAAEKSAKLVECAMNIQYDIAIAEVLPKLKYLDPYLYLAKKYDYKVKVVDMKISVEDAFKRNTHDVPKDSLQEFLDEWEDYDNRYLDQVFKRPITD